MKNKFKILNNQRASASTVIVFLLTIGIFVYIFASSKKDTATDIAQEGFEGYLNYEIIAMDIMEKIQNNEILLKENQFEDFKNMDYGIRVKRGDDFAMENSSFLISYLIDIQKENDSFNAMQYMIVGVPSALDYEEYKYHMVMFRKKSGKGV